MTPHLLLTLPVAIPLATLALCALLQRRPALQRAISLLGSAGLLIASGLLLRAVFDGTVLATQFGRWPAPFGISFVADRFAAAMVVITGLMAVAVSVYALASGAKERERAWFHPLYHGLLLGVTGAFLTGDIFNLYVWFEIMLIASFGLLVQGGTRAQLDAGVKYVVLNLLVTTLFLLGVGLLYGLTGTLNMADLSVALPQVPNQGLVGTLALLFLLAFGAKAAVFPLFFWLPAAYHTASAPVVAIFAALLTKVGIYVLLRLSTLLFSPEAGHSAGFGSEWLAWGGMATLAFVVATACGADAASEPAEPQRSSRTLSRTTMSAKPATAAMTIRNSPSQTRMAALTIARTSSTRSVSSVSRRRKAASSTA